MSDPRQNPEQIPELQDEELEDVSGGLQMAPRTGPVLSPPPTTTPPPVYIDPPEILPLPREFDPDV